MPFGRMTLITPVADDGQGARVGPDPAIATNARVLEFYHFWLARRGNRRFPSRRDIEPISRICCPESCCSTSTTIRSISNIG
jgi:hypothetical protein